jgi:hypothetical protein
MKTFYLFLLTFNFIVFQYLSVGVQGQNNDIEQHQKNDDDAVKVVNNDGHNKNNQNDSMSLLSTWKKESFSLLLNIPSSKNDDNNTILPPILSSDVLEALNTLFANDATGADSKKNSTRDHPRKENVFANFESIIPMLSSIMDLSAKEYGGISRRNSVTSSKNKWMHLRRRRGHHLVRRWNQWKTEQTNFLKNNPDESMLGILEYQTCTACQRKLGETNIQTIQDKINQMEEVINDLNITENIVQTMNESIHQHFLSKYKSTQFVLDFLSPLFTQNIVRYSLRLYIVWNC